MISSLMTYLSDFPWGTIQGVPESFITLRQVTVVANGDEPMSGGAA
jgi:hypothetical protein